MSLFIASLNSGSNGNCYYIGNGREAVLIDAGLSCRETEKRMKRLELSMQQVKALFISHEHADHIRGVEVIARKYQLPVYITAATLRSSGLKIAAGQALGFKAFAPVRIGGLSVTAFPKLHDAADPHSFIVEGNGTRIGVFTDIGAACANVTRYFKHCHAAFLEANYDEEMLETGRYPHYLKRRIRSDHGHLSNDQALELFTKHRPQAMSHVLLSHLSRDNNSPQLVQELFQKQAGSTHVCVASRYEESAVYCIAPGALPDRGSAKPAASEAAQLSLFQ